MSQEAPIRVALYASVQHTSHRVAEFHWQPGQSVSLRVLDPKWGALAQDFYDNGVPAGPGRVPAGTGPEFMCALLRPFRMGYYRFVNESD